MGKTLYFGGSFNPIHIGHLMTARSVAEQLGLDKVVLIPCKNPYHKSVDMASYEIRLLMCHMAIKTFRDPIFSVSDAERFTEGNSYTYDLLKRITNDFSNKPLWLIGSDNAKSILTWHNFNELRTKVKFIVVNRNPSQKMQLTNPELPYEHEIITAPIVETSSTEIRQRVKEQKSIAWLVPHVVEEIIIMERLYQKCE